jgi:hypothetical protein
LALLLGASSHPFFYFLYPNMFWIWGCYLLLLLPLWSSFQKLVAQPPMDLVTSVRCCPFIGHNLGAPTVIKTTIMKCYEQRQKTSSPLIVS